MSSKICYLFADANLTVVLLGRPYDIPSTHLHYKEVVELLSAPEGETSEEEEERCSTLEKLAAECSLADVIREVTLEVKDIQVEGGVVYARGIPAHGSLAKRIIDLNEAGLPYDSFIRFMVNLEKNPSERSRQELFSFLEQGKFPLTDDGCFLGYKGVTSGTLTDHEGNVYNTLVDGHTRSLDMSPGNTHSMPWAAVDDNHNTACGSGFHVGTIDHARGFGSAMVVVKVNPKDCVSVPSSDTTKLRCCAYSVVGMFEDSHRAQEFSLPAYAEEDLQEDDWEEDNLRRISQQQDRQKEEGGKGSLQESMVDELRTLNRDDLCRRASSEGYFYSTNEARWAGKDFVLSTMTEGLFPLEGKSEEWLRSFAKKRRVVIDPSAALSTIIFYLSKSLDTSRGLSV